MTWRNRNAERLVETRARHDLYSIRFVDRARDPTHARPDSPYWRLESGRVSVFILYLDGTIITTVYDTHEIFLI